MVSDPAAARTTFVALAAELGRHCLHAVTNTQNRNTELEYVLRSARCRILRGGCGAVGKNDASRIKCSYEPAIDIAWMNFGIDARLADAPSYQLGVLRSKIEDEDFLMHG